MGALTEVHQLRAFGEYGRQQCMLGPMGISCWAFGDAGRSWRDNSCGSGPAQSSCVCVGMWVEALEPFPAQDSRHASASVSWDRPPLYYRGWTSACDCGAVLPCSCCSNCGAARCQQHTDCAPGFVQLRLASLLTGCVCAYVHV